MSFSFFNNIYPTPLNFTQLTLRYQITKCVGVARSEGYILGSEWAYGLDRGADTSTNKPHCFL